MASSGAEPAGSDGKPPLLSVTSVRSEVEDTQTRVMKQVGRIAVTGRYVRLPRRIEDDWKLAGKVLGTGFNGNVVLANSVHNPEDRAAIKSFELHGLDAEQKHQLENELEIFLSLDHPQIARLMAVYESENTLSLVMEVLEGGELFERVVKNKTFTELDAAVAANEMFRAISYIHTRGVVHRDLKPENFMYSERDGDFLKLIDFGFSKFYRGVLMQEALGTLPYAAPEVLNRNYSHGSCDLWSLGVIVFILLSGHMPFTGKDDSHLVRAIRSGKYRLDQKRWHHISADAKDFVQRLLIVDTAKRLTTEQAFAHPWLKDTAHSRDLTSATTGAHIATGFYNFAQATRFQRACLHAMAWNMSLEERREIRDSFIQFVGPKGGQVRLSELQPWLNRYFGDDSNCKTRAADIMQALQSVHEEEGFDARIGYCDFLAAMMASSNIDQHSATVHNVFRQFDVDGLGYLRKEALQEILGEDYDVEGIFAEADLDHDGVISIDDFVEYLRSINRGGPPCLLAAGSVNSASLEKYAVPQERKRSKIKRFFQRLTGCGDLPHVDSPDSTGGYHRN